MEEVIKLEEENQKLKLENEKLRKDYNSLLMDLTRYKGKLEQADDVIHAMLEKLID